MKVTHSDLRRLFSEFWQERDHKEVPPISLVPQNDPTTLFTGSGMQPLVPYLLGEPHPLGEKLYNIQPCFRAQDIEEIGDNRHTTSFEMMGNWSLGTYFKKEQIPWYYEFLTKKLGLSPKKLFVTAFEGYKEIPKDTESADLWQKAGIAKDHILFYGPDKNWWSRAGHPDNMPAGEPGGPDTEVFYDFGEDKKIHESSPFKDEKCHPNCDCGRFMEIGNSVFMQYQKQKDGSFKDLPKMNVDFGGGFERALAAANDEQDVFKTDLYMPIIKHLEKASGRNYHEGGTTQSMRIIADHIKASVFLISDGVLLKSSDQRGAVLRRLLNRASAEGKKIQIQFKSFLIVAESVIKTYADSYGHLNANKNKIIEVLNQMEEKTSRTILQKAMLTRHLSHLNDENFSSEIIKNNAKKYQVDFNLQDNSRLSSLASLAAGTVAYDMKASQGFPLADSEELARGSIKNFNKDDFYRAVNPLVEKQRELSRTSGQKLFKGGLADHSDQVLKYHTATHLIHQALFDVFGDDIRQEGSNITKDRLRFDFYSSIKPDEKTIKKVEDIINEKVKESLPMRFKMMPKEEAIKIGARSFFREKYPDTVKVYYLGGEDNKPETAYSKEFCGGPHVRNTKEIGPVKIYKFESIGSNLYRIYAK